MRRERPAREKRRKEKQPAVMEGCPLLLLLLLMLLPTLLPLLCLSSEYARFNAVARAIVSSAPACVACLPVATFFGDESRLGQNDGLFTNDIYAH